MIRRWANFWRLPPAERWLTFQSLPLLAVTQLALRFLPPVRVTAWLHRRTKPEAAQTQLTPLQIGRSVERATLRFLGEDHCLAQALVGEFFLTRYGYPNQVLYGVQKDAHGALRAHAWVECNGRVVVGERGVRLDSYTPLNSNHKSSSS